MEFILRHCNRHKNLILPFGDMIKTLRLTIKMKAVVQYFPVVLFVLLYSVVLALESVDETLQCEHSSESY